MCYKLLLKQAPIIGLHPYGAITKDRFKINTLPNIEQATKRNRIALSAIFAQIPSHPLHRVFELQRHCRGLLRMGRRARRALGLVRPRPRATYSRRPVRRVHRNRQRRGNLRAKASAQDGEGDPAPFPNFPVDRIPYANLPVELARSLSPAQRVFYCPSPARRTKKGRAPPLTPGPVSFTP